MKPNYWKIQKTLKEKVESIELHLEILLNIKNPNNIALERIRYWKAKAKEIKEEIQTNAYLKRLKIVSNHK